MKEKKLLTEIMQNFVGGKLPVKVVVPPVRTSISRWELSDKKILRKTYMFLSFEERNAFLYTLLQQDAQPGVRPAKTTVEDLQVTVELGAKSGILLDLDKQRAKMTDSLWRDVVSAIGGRSLDETD